MLAKSAVYNMREISNIFIYTCLVYTVYKTIYSILMQWKQGVTIFSYLKQLKSNLLFKVNWSVGKSVVHFRLSRKNMHVHSGGNSVIV